MDRDEESCRDREDDRLGEEGDRLGERERQVQRGSEAETEREMSVFVREYDMADSDREVERSPLS